MTKTPQQIIAGMTDAQKEVMLVFDETDSDVKLAPNGHDEVVHTLLSMGLIGKIMGAGYPFISIMPLGLQVRALLQERN